MAALRSVPLDEIRRVATANTDLVQVAKSLAELAKATDDAQLAESLRRQAGRILDSTDTINDAIQSSAPVVPS
jgi:hypothetical protein